MTVNRESHLLRTREYCNELRRRKDQTTGLESSLVVNHGAALQPHNVKSSRVIDLVPIGYIYVVFVFIVRTLDLDELYHNN